MRIRLKNENRPIHSRDIQGQKDQAQTRPGSKPARRTKKPNRLFGRTAFAISEKVAKKMGVKMGGQLDESQVDELLKDKK
jgi:hypothetical protein